MTSPNLTLVHVQKMIHTAFATANARNVLCSIAIIGADGHLLSFVRQDGAISGSVELAINKAFTAQVFNVRTDKLGALAQPGAELFGIQHSHGGRVVVFGGGIPIQGQTQKIGAIGVSGGTIADDIAIAEAGAEALHAVLSHASVLCDA
ncbi:MULTISPECIES: heme-binding protein [Rhizobium/Agrobacterium group]|uniref:Heme-binding protein n=1 Tax=Rhizobium rhizogenes TaxID=359 RepID=A0A546X3D4_RHIRH|nr:MULTISPECIES: heme-binding protein [Rhizobium/Agrobacterium group]TRA95271.1 heme-binding protein [Rhizobium rhizogenes]